MVTCTACYSLLSSPHLCPPHFSSSSPSCLFYSPSHLPRWPTLVSATVSPAMPPSSSMSRPYMPRSPPHNLSAGDWTSPYLANLPNQYREQPMVALTWVRHTSHLPILRLFEAYTHSLATLFLNTAVLTFNVHDNNSFFCQTLRPPSPLPSPDNTSGLYCPIPAGPFAFSAYAPLSSSHELATLQTSLRAVDPFSNEVLCVNIATTPLHPGALGSVYGHAKLIFYGTVSLCAAYWLLVATARMSSAWARRSGWSRSGFWPRVENVGFVVASALSGEGLSKSPALMRFGMVPSSVLELVLIWLPLVRPFAHPPCPGRSHTVHARRLLSHAMVCCPCYGRSPMARIYL